MKQLTGRQLEMLVEFVKSDIEFEQQGLSDLSQKDKVTFGVRLLALKELLEVLEQEQAEPTPRVLRKDILEAVRENELNVDEDDDSKDSEISQLSNFEILQATLNWNGIIGYTNQIKSWVENIWGVDLD